MHTETHTHADKQEHLFPGFCLGNDLRQNKATDVHVERDVAADEA